jgi:predicted XRE-type DNA-binding protein
MSLTAAETRIKAKLPLRVKRFFLNMTQMQLSNLTGINTARISLFETGQLILNEREKMKISTVMGKIDWEATENSLDDFAMPKVDPNRSNKVGMVIRRLKNPDENAGLDQPVLLSAGVERDTDNYTYEPVKDGRIK